MPLSIPALMLTTGPVTAYPEVLAAQARPVLYDALRSFGEYYEEVVGKVQTVMRLSNKPVVLQGEAILGIEAAAASLIGRDDVVLNLVSGVYGKGFEIWARRYGREVLELAVAYDQALDPTEVEVVLRRRPDIAVVSVCHHDTPSGTLNPLAEIGRIVAAHGALLIVDAVSSFGGMDVHSEAVHADAFIASSSKCLGSTPGLSLVALSERAWAKIDANIDAPRASFLSLADWREAWRPERPFPVTPSISLVYGLDAAIDRYAAEGPEAVWARHAKSARAARDGVRALGLTLWPSSDSIAAPTATVLRVPHGFSDTAIRDLMLQRSGVLVSLGRRDTAGKVLRIAHMGVTAQPTCSATAVAALGGALAELGYRADVEVATAAALSASDETSR